MTSSQQPAGPGPVRRARTVGTFPASLFVLRDTDLVGLISSSSLPLASALGLAAFDVPLPLPALEVGLAWHPRHDADPAHAWLRACVRDLMVRVNPPMTGVHPGMTDARPRETEKILDGDVENP